MKKLVCLILALIVFAFIFNEVQERYYSIKADWSCDNQTFENEYCKLYNDEILRLKEKYSLACDYVVQSSTDENGDLAYNFYLYCEDYTIYIHTANCSGGEIGFYGITAYYYGDQRLEGGYSSVKSVAEFLNEITNYMAYDTKDESNQFEILYYQAESSENKYASNYYHFDNYVGNIGYYVDLNENAGGLSAGYYYMLQKNSSLKPCYKFSFNGLLKKM